MPRPVFIYDELSGRVGYTWTEFGTFRCVLIVDFEAYERYLRGSM